MRPPKISVILHRHTRTTYHMLRYLAILMLTCLISVLPYSTVLTHATSDSRSYAIGTPTLQPIWVDPVTGDDQHPGTSRDTAKRTLTAAWELIPADTQFTTGYQILLTPGTYESADVPTQWADRHGTAQFPIVLTASDGANTATISSTLSLSHVDYFYLSDLTVAPISGGPAIHCSRCTYFLLKNMTVVAATNSVDTPSLSVSQSHHVYLEESNVRGAVSYNAVHYGHIYGNSIHDASNNCLTTGTGSALLTIDTNRIDGCGGSGYSAGQNSGFEDMQAPWIHYDAYDIKFRNNIITNTQATGMTVSAGYNVLLANNTLYNTGTTTAPIAIQLGRRVCVSDVRACGDNVAQRGWGTSQLNGSGVVVPNRNVFIFNNVIVNPSSAASLQHLIVAPPQAPSSASHIPSPSRADDNLRIAGNVWWNGATNLPLGVGGSQGCSDSNLTCNTSLIRANNRINTVQPEFTDGAANDFHPLRNGNLTGITSITIPDFPDLRPALPQAPLGNLVNLVIRDYANTLRQNDAPGAYANAVDGATITPQPDQPSATRTATLVRNTVTPSRTLRPSLTPSITRSPTSTYTPSITRSPTSTHTPSITRSPTRTYTPSITYTPRSTATNSRTASITRSRTNTRTPSSTNTPRLTATNTQTASNTRSPSNTHTPSNTYTPRATATNSRTASNTRTASPTITPTPIEAVPIIPRIDATAKAVLMKIHLKGLGLGNYENTFAKAGDSISSSESFLMDIGCGSENLADYKSLQTTIDYFRSRQFHPMYGSGWCRVSNSFNINSPSAQSGWSANYALNPDWLYAPYKRNCMYPYDIPITCTFKIMRPSIVFILFGTNDVTHAHTSDFRFVLSELVKVSIDNGIIPVLSTIPPRTDNSMASRKIPMFNSIIIDVAKYYRIPLWNYWLALQSPAMIHFGMHEDNLHPSTYRGNQSADFSQAGLRYGYNQRNLQALQILDSIRRIIFLNGPPDTP
jgi:hypothetical protein